MLLGIEHLGLMVKDPLKLAEWYEQTLGFQRVFQSDDTPPIIFLTSPKAGMIELVPYPKDVELPEKDKRIHIALAVDDFDQAEKELRAKGVDFPEPVMHLFKGGKTLFFQDPEGNWLQIVYRPEAPWKI
jgi:catechol 2,3-dioxygenase-like lactoylglutathione lyase family enzyme